MSELIHTNAGKKFFRQKLLGTVCAIALVCAGSGEAAAQDDKPTVWIELGGQLEELGNNQETFAPPFLSSFDHLHLEPVLPAQSALRSAFGAEGKIFFEPNGSDWVFSAAIRYGRSNGNKASSQRLNGPKFPFHYIYIPGFNQPGTGFRQGIYHLETTAASTERHVIADFQAGKDIGLGMFGSHGSSKIQLGVRFAQFTSSRKVTLGGQPDFAHRGTEFKYVGTFSSHHRYSASANADRSFRGVGPSLSWDASTPVGRGENSEIALDWGLNAAILFGRQKVKGSRSITGSHYKSFDKITRYFVSTKYSGVASSYHHQAGINRSRSVIVPNLGGFAGLSFRYSSAKVSFGYRGNFFFGAMDGGIDAHKSYDRNFYGPFATISVGFGG